jgi:hypothetical protein
MDAESNVPEPPRMEKKTPNATLLTDCKSQQITLTPDHL